VRICPRQPFRKEDTRLAGELVPYPESITPAFRNCPLKTRARAARIPSGVLFGRFAWRFWDIGCGFFSGPEGSRDCRFGLRRCCLSGWLASWQCRDLMLLLVPISSSPGIIPHRFSPSILFAVLSDQSITRNRQEGSLSGKTLPGWALWCSGAPSRWAPTSLLHS